MLRREVAATPAAGQQPSALLQSPEDPYWASSRLAIRSTYPYSASNLVLNSLSRGPNGTFHPHRPIPSEA